MVAPGTLHGRLVVLVLRLFVVVLGVTCVEATAENELEGGGDHRVAVIERITKLLDAKDYDRAEALARRLWAGDPSRTDALDLLVQIRMRPGPMETDETLALALQSVGLHARSAGPRGSEAGRALFRLGRIRRARDEIPEAKSSLKEALVIQDAIPGIDELEIATTLVQLGHALCESGEYLEARPIYDRALEIRRRKLPANDVRIADVLNGQANLISDLGDYVESRHLYEEVLRIRVAARGPYDRSVAVVKHNLGILLTLIGDFAGARTLLDEAGAIWDGKYDPASSDRSNLADNLTAIADLLLKMGSFEEARDLLKQSIAIRRGERLTESPFFTMELNNLGVVEYEAGHFKEARALFDEALKRRCAAWGETNPLTAATLLNLGLVLDAENRPEQALPFLRRSLAAYEGSLPRSHPDRADVLQVVARVELRLGDTDGALASASEAEQVSREHAILTIGVLPESQAYAYANRRPSGLGVALTVLESPTAANAIRAVWNEVILSRERALDEVAERQRAIHGTHEGEFAALAAAYRNASARFANILVHAATVPATEDVRRRIEQAARDKDQAERTLAEQSLEYRRLSAKRKAGYDKVMSSIPAGAALVSYVRYDGPVWEMPGDPIPAADISSTDSRTEPRYGVFIKTPGDLLPAFLPLGPAFHIDELVASWLEEAGPGHKASSRTAAAAMGAYLKAGIPLREAVWDKVRARLADRTDAVIVPDGALSLVNLDALPLDGNRFLLDEPLKLHYISAERDLVPEPGPEGRGLLAVGGPDFGNPLSAASPTTTRIGPFLPLAGARQEAAEIVDLWNRPKRALNAALFSVAASLMSLAWLKVMRPPGAGARTRIMIVATGVAGAAVAGFVLMPIGRSAAHLEGLAASEEAVKRLAPGRRIVHLATHAYFSRPFALTGTAGTDPLSFSGLALSGANQAAERAGNENEGILTSPELATLDLTSAELVVLSACGAEGPEVQDDLAVAGLRRAIRTAGARSLVLSLWQVEDEPTREWMAAFYKGLLRDHVRAADAAHLASSSVLERRRKNGLSPHPFYWAAFVSSGM